MPEWLYHIEQTIAGPALVGGLIAGIITLFLPNQNKAIRFSGAIFIGFASLFILLRTLTDWILINWGLGVPFWGEFAYSDENLMKIPEVQRDLRISIHNIMWTLIFRVFPVGFLFTGGLLTVLSIFQKQKWKVVQITIIGAFLLFSLFFVLTLIEQTIGIKGTFKG